MKLSDICNFSPPHLNTVKHNVIIVTLFRLKNLYKNFDVYLNGLIGFDNYLSNLDVVPNNIKLRVYWNKSVYKTNDKNEFNLIKKVFNRIKKNKHIQLVEYSCELYKINNTYDKGIFPFFIRYFPLFNFEDNDTNYIYSTDIDINSHKQELNYFDYLINDFNNMIEKKMDLYCLTSKCYIPFWKKKLGDDSISLLGSKIGGCYKFNYTILTEFLNKCEYSIKSNDKLISLFYKNYIEYIRNRKIPMSLKLKKDITYKISKIFVYGLDEFFITYYLFTYALNNKKIKNIYEHTCNVSYGGLYGLLSNILKNVLDNNNTPRTMTIYRDILYKVTKKKYTLENIINELNNFIKQFKNHDYDNITDKPKKYNKFHKELMKYIDNNFIDLNIKKNRDFDCFLKNNIYYTDKNNIIKLDKKTKKLYLENLIKK